jgi:hypothetical protein
MKNATLVLGAFAGTFAAAAIYLGVQLGDTRERLAQEEQARAAAQARIGELEDEQRRLFSELADTESGVLAASPPPAAQPSLVDRRQPADLPASPGGTPFVPPAGRRNNVDDSPAARNAMRLQQEVRLRRRYADMPAELGLDATQADRLFDLLADHQLAQANDARAYEGDRLGRQAIEAAAREKRDVEIEALLGPDKAAEFQSFEQSIPARMQVSRIGESMAAANVPLSETQRKTMITTVAGELESKPPPERFKDGNLDPDYEARYLDWQADYSRRVQSSLEPMLTAEQARHYREAVQVQNARRADRRERVESRRNEPVRQ